jgi:hypothetical protein
MAARVPTRLTVPGHAARRLTAAEGRRFGLTVGGAFLALGSFLWWRGRSVPGVIAATLGSTLILAGLLLPTRLGPVERAWMRLALAISRVTTPIFMGVVYGLVITPIAVLRRALGNNPLRHPADAASYWFSRDGAERQSDLGRQF